MNKEKVILYLIHYGIIVWIFLTVLNSAYQISFVYTVPGHSWPLMGESSGLDYETMMIRRAYAIEAWVAMVGLAIYLAITEINPRLKRIREQERKE